MKKTYLLIGGILIVVGLGMPAFHIFLNAQKSAAFSKVEDSKPPLTVAEVEKLMGSPAHIEHSETTGITGDVYHYPTSSGADMKVVFINGTVFHAELVPGTKA